MRFFIDQSLRWIFLTLAAAILLLVDSACELGVVDSNKLYNYSLAAPSPGFPHGVLSEDGFYKVAVNETVLWFQLCSSMIFDHNPPTCINCTDCGGSSRCGMGCSALVSNNIGGYPVCTTIARTSSTIRLIDEAKPQMGVVVQMSITRPMLNCSLDVSVTCDSSGLKEPQTLEVVGPCNYATKLRHPSGCARIAAHGIGLGWFGTFMIIILSLFGAYLVAGIVYRHFFLRISGIDAIPNLEFWASLPHRIQSMFMSLIRRFRGPSQGYRSSYSPVNF